MDERSRRVDGEPAHRPRLPPPGPAWFPAVMGTGGLALACGQFAGTELRHTVWRLPVAGLGLALATLGWCVAVVLVAGFVVACRRRPGLFRDYLVVPGSTAMWGTVTMGLLSVASATLAASSTLPHVVPPGVARTVFAATWWPMTTLGALGAIVFATRLLTGDAGKPSVVWGLPLVTSMVSATTGATLAGLQTSATAATWILAISVGSFFLSLGLGGAAFLAALVHAWFLEPLAEGSQPTAWVPLGMAGQSTAAAQAVAAASAPWLAPPAVDAVAQVAHVYGVVALVGGLPLALWAARVHYTALPGLPFSNGWWSAVFPVSTVVLGALLLFRSAGWGWALGIAVAATGVLVAHWTLAAAGTVRYLAGLRQ